MASYKVTIKYAGPTSPESIRFASPVCSCFTPCNSYVDTAAYAGTVYDTNVKGFGSIDLMEPYASTAFPFPVPLAQFKLAVIGEDVVGKSGKATGEKQVVFEVASYMEAFWYIQAGAALADQGFTVTAEEATAETSEAKA